jgi:hypothetical protein
MAKNERLPKDQVERRVFAEFAEVCPLDIDPDSIQSRPAPEPDILCTTKTGDCVAIEMVRCDDEGGTQTVNRGASLVNSFREFLATYPRREELLGHLEGRDILPHYQVGITERQMRENFSALCDFLLASDVSKRDLNPYHPVPCPRLQRIVREVSLGIQSHTEPTLHYFPANWIPRAEDAILNAAKSKREKRYQTAYPIELLVWFGIMPEFVNDQTWASLLNQVPSLLRETVFGRLWVYSWGKRQILFVYP